MTDILSLPFEYKQRTYTALISTKENKDHKEYRVTIMNGELEKLLYGHHIIIEKNGSFLSDEVFENSDIKQLQQAILKALADHCNERIGRERQEVC